jgi:hypothetical protein
MREAEAGHEALLVVVVWLAETALIYLFDGAREALGAWLKDNQHLSGWAQAVGAIVALYVAFAVGQRQMLEARLLDQAKSDRSDSAKIRVVEQLFINARRAIVRTHDTILGKTGDTIESCLSEMRHSSAAIEALPVLELPGPGLLAIYVSRAPPGLREFERWAQVVYAETERVRAEQFKSGRLRQEVSLPSRMKMFYDTSLKNADAVCAAGEMSARTMAHELTAPL